MFSKLWQCQIIWYLFAGFKAIVLCLCTVYDSWNTCFLLNMGCENFYILDSWFVIQIMSCQIKPWRCSWTDQARLLMFQKVFQALISSDMNVNLRFSFTLWIVTSGTSCPEHSLFIYCSPKIYLNDSLVFKLFVFFSGYTEYLFTK